MLKEIVELNAYAVDKLRGIPLIYDRLGLDVEDITVSFALIDLFGDDLVQLLEEILRVYLAARLIVPYNGAAIEIRPFSHTPEECFRPVDRFT